MSVMKILQIIMLILWVFVGIFFLIIPQPITKFEFACTWISVICFISLNLLNKGGKKK